MVQLKKDPTYKELLEIARFKEKEKTIGGEQGRANATQGAGGGAGGCAKKKEGFIKCFLCGAIGHKSNTCTMDIPLMHPLSDNHRGDQF